MEVKKLDFHVRPMENGIVRLKTMGNVQEIFWSSKRSSGNFIQKLDKDHYVNLQTGEYLEFEHQKNRSENLQSVARSLSQGRDLLNANIVDTKKCRWVTLTYSDNMTDPKKLQKDFENFNVRLRRKYGHYEYITAAEPQGRGAWHLHVVLIFSGPAPYIPNEIMAAAWKQGFVTVKKLDDVDNVGAYLTAYLGDLELTEAKFEGVKGKIKEVDVEVDGTMQKKRYVKGGRLCMYPPGFHIFRWSKGIKKPTVTYMTAGEANEKVGAATLTFEKTVALSDETSSFEATLNYRYYNSKRRR